MRKQPGMSPDVRKRILKIYRLAQAQTMIDCVRKGTGFRRGWISCRTCIGRS